MKESALKVRTHRLHIVMSDDPRWRNDLQFRDMLRAGDRLRTHYGELKTTLQERFAQDRKPFTEAMSDFSRGSHSVIRSC
jgi:GrpB-like predicted nucleotidyltransferase (UPF0157 family)